MNDIPLDPIIQTAIETMRKASCYYGDPTDHTCACPRCKTLHLLLGLYK